MSFDRLLAVPSLCWGDHEAEAFFQRYRLLHLRRPEGCLGKSCRHGNQHLGWVVIGVVCRSRALYACRCGQYDVLRHVHCSPHFTTPSSDMLIKNKRRSFPGAGSPLTTTGIISTGSSPGHTGWRGPRKTRAALWQWPSTRWALQDAVARTLALWAHGTAASWWRARSPGASWKASKAKVVKRCRFHFKVQWGKWDASAPGVQERNCLWPRTELAGKMVREANC